MNEKTTSQVLVIGLGGCGGQVVNLIQESDVDHITCLHLDVNSQIFGDFFSGYMHEVGKRILDGVQSFRSELSTVVDAKYEFSPLRTIFMQGTSRALMRTSLLLFRKILIDHLNYVIDCPTRVHIVCSTSGRTGSGWVLDIASMVRSMLPNTPIEVSLVIDFPNNYEARITSSKCRTYWTLREFQSYSDPSIKTTIEPTIGQAILSIIPSTEEIRNPDTNIDANELITSVLREISLDIFETDFFWRERSRTVSDLITNETKNLIAGYMLACAEGRSNGFSEERYLEFSSQQTKNLYKINFVCKDASHRSHQNSSWSEYSSLSILRGYGLAIIPYENWDELQVEAFQKICTEGLSARSGQASNLSTEARASLISLKDHFLNSIDQLSIIPDEFHAKNYASVLPHYVAIAEEILSDNS